MKDDIMNILLKYKVGGYTATLIYKELLSLHSVRYRFDIPDAEIWFSYYDDTAYFDREGFYMYDQDGKKQRPSEKYLVMNDT